MLKLKSLLFILFLATSFACNKKEVEIPVPVNPFAKFVGTWSPYELTDFGAKTTDQGTFTHNSFFGVYDESVKIQLDGKYIPGVWENDKLKEDNQLEEIGTVTFENNHLIFKSNEGGIFFKKPLDFLVEKQTTNELWLKSDFRLIKLKKVE